ncbi:aldo/keto reductase [Demequina sp. NBRC 110052]|uniref:aldo/keto reductase n=1 Tax=Demequina sp. NBRC 110052 TaxID=1570341 RepID=UPI000A008314|nr:aldo/keto reductase [Demequina sp. NBRC 110052]
METVTLNNGVEMPMLGLGVYRVTRAEDCIRAVRTALDAGYRLIDTAAVYGNESAVGRAIAESGVPREEIFLTTKIWVRDFGATRTPVAFSESLERLGTDYVDLMLLHQPYGDWPAAWRALEPEVAAGRARAIGVSNFIPSDLERLRSFASVPPAVNQVERHPYIQRPELDAAHAADGTVPEAWEPIGKASPELLRDPVLVALADKYGKSVAQVILRWQVQSGYVAIPKSTSAGHIAENIAIFDFALSDEEMASIAGLDRGRGRRPLPRWLMGLAVRAIPVRQTT